MDIKHSHRDLASWSHEEWIDLDIHLFIVANFSRYCSSLVKRVGVQYLPSDASESLLGLYCDVAWKPLKSVHKKNLDAEGERRNQVMLGTLKMISCTRMVDALIREFPCYISLEQLPEFDETDPLEDEWDYDFFKHITFASESEPLRRALFAAEDFDLSYEMPDDDDEDDNKLTLMLEKMRSYLTPIQYRHLRYAICEHMDSQDIADHTGHSITNARIILLNMRKKMIDMVPDDMSNLVADCVLRK